MRILVIANHYTVCSGRYISDAFARLGHEVRHVGQPMGRRIWGLDVPERYVWMPDEYPGDEWADLIVIADSDSVILDGSRQFAQRERGSMVVYGVDNHVRHYRRPWIDHYFLAHHDGPVQAVRQADETWLPCAYDPAKHTPSPLPYAERVYDVAMIGVMYPERVKLIHELRAAGFKVLAGTGLVHEDYCDAYQNARISLCMSIAGDVAQRVFETAAMGCVVMSDLARDLNRLKPDGFWIYDPRDVVAGVRAILSDPANAQVNIALSMDWVRAHTWDARCQQIINVVTEAEGNTVPFTGGQVLPIDELRLLPVDELRHITDKALPWAKRKTSQ